VVTVQQAVVSFFDTTVVYPGDYDLTEFARKTALAETEEVLDQIADDSRPASVAVQAVVGVPAEELLKAAADADMIVVGSRGGGGFTCRADRRGPAGCLGEPAGGLDRWSSAFPPRATTILTVTLSANSWVNGGQ